jgi:uncharacterized membrane protein
MQAAMRHAHDRSRELERIISFSDGVFSIVITLLVLPITAEVEPLQAGDGFAAEVWALWPKVLSFVVSFLVIGQFWVAHHRLFEHVQRHDRHLLGLNLVSLLTICFLPFPTALLGEHYAERFTLVFYAASLTLASLTLTAIWFYALRFGDLVDRDLDDREASHISWRAILTPALLLLSVVVTAAGWQAAVAFWLVLLPGARAVLLRLCGRHAPSFARNS